MRLAVERGCTGLIILKGFTVGCAKVNCGNAAREGALGYDLGAPHVNSFSTDIP